MTDFDYALDGRRESEFNHYGFTGSAGQHLAVLPLVSAPLPPALSTACPKCGETIHRAGPVNQLSPGETIHCGHCRRSTWIANSQWTNERKLG